MPIACCLAAERRGTRNLNFKWSRLIGSERLGLGHGVVIAGVTADHAQRGIAAEQAFHGATPGLGAGFRPGPDRRNGAQPRARRPGYGLAQRPRFASALAPQGPHPKADRISRRHWARPLLRLPGAEQPTVSARAAHLSPHWAGRKGGVLSRLQKIRVVGPPRRTNLNSKAHTITLGSSKRPHATAPAAVLGLTVRERDSESPSDSGRVTERLGDRGREQTTDSDSRLRQGGV
jgi:hypothetical protein